MTDSAHSKPKLAPGLGAAFLVGMLAILTAMYVPTLSATLMALLIGILAGNSILGKAKHQAGIRFTEKYVLETAIVLIGFGFQLELLLQLGWPVFGWLLFSVVAVVAFASFAGRLFGSSSSFNILLGAGSAICGSAAIAATAPLIKANEEETGLALTLINLLGLIGIVVLPLLSFSFGYNELQAGVLTGGVLQSMGHVVAAAFSLSETTGEAATVVKMGRIALLVPFLVLVYLRQRRNNKKSQGPSARLKFPIFIALFMVAVGMSQLRIFPENWSESLANVGDYLLIFAMAGIGLKIRIRPLLKISGKGSLIGLSVFLFQILLFITVLSLHWI